MIKEYVVGVDIGGQTAKLGLVNSKGDILARSIITTKVKEPEVFIASLAEAISDMIKNIGIQADSIKGVGVGAPDGNYYTGDIVNATNVIWAQNRTVHFAQGLSKNLGGVQVTVTNDANAAAIGEKKYGIAKKMKNFIMITLGTGVGSGIIIDGRLVYGSDGFAGELGHTCAIRGGRPCGCGQKGCLEAYCSATGVARTAVEMLAKGKSDSLLSGVKNITSKDVFEAAEKGDALAKKIFTYTGKIMGEKFADFIPFSAPEAIILFGGLTHAKDYFMKALVDSMNKNVVFLWKGKVKVLVSALKESDAAILGASALAW